MRLTKKQFGELLNQALHGPLPARYDGTSTQRSLVRRGFSRYLDENGFPVKRDGFPITTSTSSSSRCGITTRGICVLADLLRKHGFET